MCNLVFSLQEFLKLVPGLVLFPFSLYFAWKKIGNKVLASISTSHEMTLAPRISSVVVRNMRDKPLTVFEIYAVIDDDVYFQVEKFDPPIIIKPLESIRIETKPYSRLNLGREIFEPISIPSKNIQLHLVLAQKTVKCKMVSHPGAAVLTTFRKYRLATKEVSSFNGVVYNADAAYAIIYRAKSEVRTSIVHRSGLICSDWDFWFNMIPPEHMKSAADLRSYLGAVGFDKVAECFDVSALNYPASPTRDGH